MSDPGGWPDPLEGEYELRVTGRARDDLGVGACLAAELEEMIRASSYADIIDKFRKMRSVDPTGTEAPLSKVHRPDVYKLDGRDGGRAVTWHDTDHGVVWLLAFSAEHDYKMMVTRAATPETRGLGGANQLFPSVEDYQDLADDRGDDWALTRVIEGLAELVESARKDPGTTCRGLLTGVVGVEALVDAARGPERLYLRFRTPPVRSGVLPSQFHWVLAGALDCIDPATVDVRPFPSVGAPGSLTVSGLFA